MKKAFIVTGASSGIGQALAINLAAKGHTVLAIARRFSLLQDMSSGQPAQLEIMQADVTVAKDREQIAAWASKQQALLYLVHNAATAEPLTLLKDLNLDDYRQQQTVNVEAPLFLTQILLPYLINGRVLHISSGLAHAYCPGTATYCMSKTALFMQYQAWREELKNQHIAVGSAIPGAVDTAMQGTIRSTSKERLPSVDSFIRFKEQGRLLSTTTVANFLSWLLLNTTAEEFSRKEWDIDDSSHHPQWLGQENIQKISIE